MLAQRPRGMLNLLLGVGISCVLKIYGPGTITLEEAILCGIILQDGPQSSKLLEATI